MFAQSPLAKYQLFRNPFGELSEHERAELAVVELSDYLQWLAHSERAALQFVGECGHGKSTHLRALQRALGQRNNGEQTVDQSWPALVYFPEEGDQPELPAERPLLIDEAQRMGWWRLRQMLRGSGPLVIGSHVDLESSLQRAGFVVRTVNLNQPISPERLQAVLNRRILASVSGRDSGHHPLCLSRTQVVVLQQQFGSNIRHIEHYLYEALQRFAEKGEPWLPVN